MNGFFIHKFKTQKSYYVFSVSNMHIYSVDKVVWSVIDDYCDLSEAEIIRKYACNFTEAEISNAINEIAVIEAGGDISRKRPKIALHYSQDDIREMLADERKNITLIVTDRCNLRCDYCIYSGNYHARHAWRDQDMSWEIAKKAMDDYFAHCRKSERPTISFYGGEPLLNMKLITRAIKYARSFDNETWFNITTNGTLLRGATADFLAENRVRLVVSLDGPRHLHDRYRKNAKGLPSWQTIIDNVSRFIDRHPIYADEYLLCFNCVLAPPLDLKEIDKFYTKYPLFQRFKKLHAFSSYIDGAAHFKPIEGKISSYADIYHDYIDLLTSGRMNMETYQSGRYNFIYPLFTMDFLKFHKRHHRYCHNDFDRREFPDQFCLLSTCIPGINRIYVSTDGRYFPCERLPELDSLRIGDVNAGVDSDAVYRLLHDWVELGKDECRSCWCLPMCQVGCWREGFDGKTITAEEKKIACQSHRRDMSRLIVDYCTILENNSKAFDFSKDVTLV